MTPFEEALAAARKSRTLAPVIALLRSGYDPLPEEWGELSSLALNCGKASSGDTETTIRYADAWDYYGELRASGKSCDQALNAASDKFGISVVVLTDVVRGGRKPVRDLRMRRKCNTDSCD